MTSLQTAFNSPFCIVRAPEITPVVVASPHSGANYPDEFLAQSRLALDVLRRSEDRFVDALLCDAPSCGASLISANFPRIYCDVNRAKWELDPTMFDGALPECAITESAKIRAGFGMIARHAGFGQPIYRKALSLPDLHRRQDLFWQPYHSALQELIAQSRARAGFCILIDGHSMPKPGPVPGSRISPDIVLGDAFGQSCDPQITALVENFWRERGFQVVRNVPYAGGYVTRHYGKPEQGVHVLQVELGRHLYMHEASGVAHMGFTALQQDLAVMMGHVVAFAERYTPIRNIQAAE